MSGLSLCKFSRSEILASSILPTCPLLLNSSQSKKCPCKRRRYHVTQYDLRVVECLFPKTFRGDLIRDTERFRENLISKGASMSTAVADPPKNATKPATASKPANANSAENNPGLWCGTPIPVIGVCGEKWSGKTLFVSSIDPQRTLMIDLEGSSTTYSSIPFKKRYDLYEVMQAKYGREPTPLECFEWFRELLNEIKPGEYTVIAVDPISDIEQGMVDWVQKNPEKFNHTKGQYDKAAGIMWGDVKSYWKMLLGIAATKVETFAFTVHMGAVWKGNAPVDGKRKAKGKETLFELSSLYLQVERPLDKDGKQSDRPSARVLKSRLAISSFVDGEMVHKPILPPYLKIATPKVIRDYIKSPPDYSKLKKTEIAPPEELSEEDKLLINAKMAEDNRVAAETNLSRMELMKRAAEEQVRMKQERDAKQEANAAQEEAKPAEDSKAGVGETVTTATGAVLPASHEALAGIQEASDRQVLKETQAKIKDLVSALQMKANTVDAILAKRGVKTIEALDLAQAEDIRGKLQSVLNDRQAAAKAAANPQ